MPATPVTGLGVILKPLLTSIFSNLGVLLPIGIGIMATMISIRLIPRIVYKFL